MDRRRLERRCDELANEVFTLRLIVRDREQELHVCQPQLYRAHRRIDRLEQQRDRLAAQNKLLKRKLADLTAQLRQEKPGCRSAPSFVKANVPAGKVRKKPGRRVARRPPHKKSVAKGKSHDGR